MIIEVTQEDINNATTRIKEKACASGNCPIALAVKRKFRRKNVTVGVGTLFFTRDDNNKLYDLPAAARKFVYQFDRGQKVAPLTFEVIE